MMYFIPWVLFLLLVILSVPIASWLDKRRLQAAYRKQFEQEDEFDEEEDEGDHEVASEGDQDAEADHDGEPVAGFSTDDVRLDGDESRSWQVLQDLDSSQLTTKFPDFDVAYLRAAYPTGNSGEHAAALPKILESGLESCVRRSWLLGRLSAYSVWNREAQKAFQYGVSALLSAREITDAPGDLVGCINLLVPVFRDAGYDDVADKLLGWNPGYDESPEMQRAIDTAVKNLSEANDTAAFASAADALRAKDF